MVESHAAAPQANQPAAAPAASESAPRFIADEDGIILHATDSLAALLGQDTGGLKGRNLNDLFRFRDEDDAIHAGALFGAGSPSRAIREGTHTVVFHAGRADTASIRFDRVRSQSGQTLLVGSFDIEGDAADTDSLQKEIDGWMSRLRQPVADPVAAVAAGTNADDVELRHFLNMSNDIMAISDREGRIRRCNATFCERLGFDEGTVLSMAFTDMVHPDDRARLRNSLHSLMHQDGVYGRVVDVEARMLDSEGNTHWVEWRQKREGGLIYSVGRDVTAAKTQEVALHVQARQLSEAQAIGHMGHWSWTVGSQEIEFSDEIFRIFGVEKAKFIPTIENMNAMLHRRDVGRLLQAFQRAILERNNYEMEFRINRPGGEVRHIRCEGRCEMDQDGDVGALFGIMQDITERNNYERQLRAAKDSAERAYAAKSQFLANMSHELRTPLNAIIGFSEMMQRQLLGPIGSARYLDYITGIRESGEHLLDLISDILDMSKMEAGKYELDLEELNAAKVVRLAVHMIEGRAHESRIQLTIEMEDEDLQIVCDRRAVMQILLNLLSNALKFTEANGSVRVKCLSRPDNFVIRVEDTGIGIPAYKLANIAMPFEQVSNHYTREHEGTGLGLAITKELTELHGGALSIESTVGKGTVVTVRLPYNAYAHVKARRRV